MIEHVQLNGAATVVPTNQLVVAALADQIPRDNQLVSLQGKCRDWNGQRNLQRDLGKR